MVEDNSPGRDGRTTSGLRVEVDYGDLFDRAARVFTPGTPVKDPSLFSGRTREKDKLRHTIQQTGYHAVLYGERGVGKTSPSPTC
jgi:hypothetical protein